MAGIEDLKFSNSPNIYGKWSPYWTLSIDDLMKNYKTLDTPYTYIDPEKSNLKREYLKGTNTTFYGNPSDSNKVRIYRGWPLMTLENRLSQEKAFKKHALNLPWNRIFDERTQKFKAHPNFRGPLTGQWYTNNPKTAYSLAGSGNKPGVLSYLDVNPKNLKNWWIKRPMEGHAYLVPQNVIQSQSRHIPIGVPTKDFSSELTQRVSEARDYKRKSNAGKWFSNFTNWLKPKAKATAGAGISLGSQSMSSPKIKGLGSAIDNPSNFYLNVNTGGLI